MSSLALPNMFSTSETWGGGSAGRHNMRMLHPPPPFGSWVVTPFEASRTSVSHVILDLSVTICPIHRACAGATWPSEVRPLLSMGRVAASIFVEEVR